MTRTHKLRALALTVILIMTVATGSAAFSSTATANITNPNVTITTDGADVYEPASSLPTSDTATEKPSEVTGVASTTVSTTAAYQDVRFTIDATGPGELQLWAEDTNGNWFNTVATGWGPASGFDMPAGFSNTTPTHIAGDPGTYTVNTSLVYAANGTVIASHETTVSLGIQNGIDAAPGSAVTVAEGTYEERVVIDTPGTTVQARGDRDNTTVRFGHDANNPGHPVFDVLVDDATIDGFTIERVMTGTNTGSERFGQGIKIGGFSATGGNGTTITDNTIRLVDNSGGTVDSNTMLGIAVLEPETGGPIGDATITNNVIEGFSYEYTGTIQDTGIFANSAEGSMTITGNELRDNDVQFRDATGAIDIPSLVDANEFDQAVTVQENPFDPVIWTTIQDGVDSVDGPSHTVRVESGTYAESVAIDQPLSLIGDGSDTTTITGSSWYAIATQGHTEGEIDGVTIDGFTLDAGTAFIALSGTVDTAPTTLNLTLNDVRTDGGAIVLSAVRHAELTNVEINGTDLGNDAGALELTGVGDLTITDSEFTNNNRSIRLQDSPPAGQPPEAYGENGPITIRDTLFTGNNESVVNDDPNVTIDATLNYWGSANGPGDTVSENVTYDPWYTTSDLSARSDDPEPTPTPDPSPPSSGGDDDDDPPPQQTQPTNGDTEFVKQLQDDDPDAPGTTIRFDPADVDGETRGPPVDEIQFDDEISATQEISVETTDDRPDPGEVSGDTDAVLRTFIVNAPTMAEDRSATIRFRVSQSELGDRDPQSVRLARQLDDGSWELYDATPIDPDADPIVYESAVDGFSTWSVVTQRAQTPAPTATPTPSPTPDPTPEPTPVLTDEPTPSPTPTDDPFIPGQPGFGIGVAIIAILAMALIAARRRAH